MKKVLMSLAALVLLVPIFGLAADVRTAEVVAKDEKVSNLYLAGQSPTVDANVTGDLVAAGGTVTVNGDVSGGVIAAGNVLINGAVAESIRVAGGTVTIDGTVGGDVLVFGGNVSLGTKSVVTGDVLVFGGTLDLKGKVLGSVKNTYVGTVTIAGNVAGNVELARVGKLTVDKAAVVVGTLKYSSQNEATVAGDAKVGKVEYTKVAATKVQRQSLGSRFGGYLFAALMAFVTLLVFINLLPKFSKKVVNNSVVNSWAKMGIGFLAMVVTPIVLLALLITVLGWGIMGYLGLTYAIFLALTGTLTALLAGSFVWKYFSKGKELELNWKTASIGVVLVALAKLIPIVGWLAAFLVALIVFGTLTTMCYEYIKAQRA